MQLMENVGIKLLAACSVCCGIQGASMVRTVDLCDVMPRMARGQSGHDEADKWLGELIESKH